MSAGGSEHPSHLTLSRFVDGDLSAEYLPEVSRHVEACDECRADVQFIRRLGATARSLEMPSPPDVAEEVIRRRRAGERGHPAGRAMGGPMRGAVFPHRFAGAVAAGLALAVVASIYLLLAPTAAATRGELRFGPLPEAAAGSSVSSAGAMDAVPVAYSPAYYLADEDSLRLRARVSRSNVAEEGRSSRPLEELRVTTLRRDEDGTFRGQLPHEPGDLFAVASVEDFGAADLDTNSGRLWDIYLERGPAGEPTLTALESRYRSLESYNWVMAVEWAEQLTQEHPGNPLGWAVKYWHLSRAHPDGVPDSVRRVHGAKLRELTSTTGVSAEPAELFWLWRYAANLGEARIRDSLFAELERRDPDHPAVGDRRVVESMAGAETAPARLERLEELWEQESQPTKLLVLLGLQNAAAARDLTAADVWLARGLDHPDVVVADLVSSISAFEELAEQRVELLRRQLADLERNPEGGRPLREASVENAADNQRSAVSLKVSLAGALAAAGDTLAAEEIFAKVADRLWRGEDIRRHVHFMLATGDTAQARSEIGLLIVDPLLDERVRAEYRALSDTEPGKVGVLVARSKIELARRIESSFPERSARIRGSSAIREYGEDVSTAAAYFDRRPTALFLWDARFGDLSGMLEAFADLGRRLATEHDIGYAVVVPALGSEENALLQRNGHRVLLDPDFSLIEQLRAFDRPVFVVIDEHLRVAARVYDPSDALRMAVALSW